MRAAFKHKTKVWSLTSSSIRSANAKPFSSDIVSAMQCRVCTTFSLRSCPEHLHACSHGPAEALDFFLVIWKVPMAAGLGSGHQASALLGLLNPDRPERISFLP